MSPGNVRLHVMMTQKIMLPPGLGRAYCGIRIVQHQLFGQQTIQIYVQKSNPSIGILQGV